ncbi:MAG: hypothetical protein ACYDHH_09425 [Solirubrobacteraceae bacterium]
MSPLRHLTAAKRAAVAASIAVVGGAASLALASSGPPAPTITSAPANPTSSTLARFTFSDSQAKVTFICSLDGSAYRTCMSPSTYKGLAEGTHSFAVEAKDATGTTSSPASYTWRIDLTPPSITIAFPADGGSYNGSGWSVGCSSGPGVCGAARDPSGVASVRVSIRQTDSPPARRSRRPSTATR